MRVGFILLAHQRLDRAAALAKYLAGHRAPVAMHVDRRIAETGLPAAPAGITLLRTRRADWGGFGLVDATLDCAGALLRWKLVDHIVLLSGSCLPLRPLPDLAAMLATNPGRDFIESVPVTEGGWVQGGLAGERFTLFHPFSWQRHRRLFDASVRVQRALRVRRRIPAGLDPHLGLQWWCLSARTLRAFLSDPRLPAWRRFYRHTWIPDEGFFQTLIRKLRPGDDPGPPLHLARFDPRGKPYVYHNDHADMLAGSGAWFARKIDPDADELYGRFLDTGVSVAPPSPEAIETHFQAARRRERAEGRGVLSAARFPRWTGHTAAETAAPYLVVLADDPAAACTVLAGDPGLAVHGDLFGDEAPRFAGGERLCAGNLQATRAVRDYRPAQFLAMTVRADQSMGRRSVFGFVPDDEASAPGRRSANTRRTIGGQIAGDPNARLVVIGDPGAMLGRLSARSCRTSRRAGPAQYPLRAWWTGVAAPGNPSNRLASIAAADWSDPAGWTIPADPPGGWPA